MTRSWPCPIGELRDWTAVLGRRNIMWFTAVSKFRCVGFTPSLNSLFLLLPLPSSTSVMALFLHDPDYHRLLTWNISQRQNVRPSDAVMEFDDGLGSWSAFRITHVQDLVLVVFIDGACLANGTPHARGGYGVYFGDESRYNTQGPLPRNENQTSQRAELLSCFAAWNELKSFIWNISANSRMRLLRRILLTSWSRWRSIFSGGGKMVICRWPGIL